VSDPSEQKQIAAIVGKLHEAFVGFDAMLCEINPLIVTPEGEVKALDSKFTVDDNALFRHPDVAEMRDLEAADPLEALARKKHVTYVRLDGDVGVLGNGAGLTMSTVDVVTFAGGRPANFCDLGGGGDAQGVVDALSVITQDPQVKAIFFNIFGGITRCDEVARGILQALGEMSLELPIVVRLDGTNAEEGRQILAEAAPANLRVEPTMLEAATRAWSWPHDDVWSERAQAYARATRTARAGPRPARRVGAGARPRSTSRPAAGTSPGGCARRARGRHLRPAPGCSPTWSAERGAPVRRRQLRRRRLAAAAHHFDDVRAAVREMARVAGEPVLVVDNASWATSRGGRALRDPRTCATTPRRVARASSRTPASRRASRVAPAPFELEPWLDAHGLRGRGGRARARARRDRVARTAGTLDRSRQGE
jgi:hypothetical protein